MMRKGRAMPAGVLRDQRAHRRQIIARERAALEADRFHCPQDLPRPVARVQRKNVQTPGPGRKTGARIETWSSLSPCHRLLGRPGRKTGARIETGKTATHCRCAEVAPV